MVEYLKINDNDNVIIAVTNLETGQVINDNNSEFTLVENIRRGHKIAVNDIKMGENIIKYGYVIGSATVDIKKGQWIHTHNLKTNLSGTIDYEYSPRLIQTKKVNGPKTFLGYRRRNGDVGIRNELWIVPTTGCVNGVGEAIINKFREQVAPIGIDHINVYKHSYGCSQLGDDHANTRTILANICKHPNAGGVLVLSLGCENNTLKEFKIALDQYDVERTKFLVTQKAGNELEEGVKLLKEIYQVMKNDSRVEVPISELKIGLKCGGSDAFSGITANPLLGEFSDYLVENGGSTILTEVSEMFGAETILMDRAESLPIFEDTVDLVNDFKEYYISHNQPIYENPSPGNKEGGLTTIEEKSLGCTQKSGNSKVVNVLNYGEVIKKRGLNLLYGPGNDLVSCTAMGASGCQMVLFTTGRGTPFGSFIPTIKVSTTTSVYNRKPHWIDFNAGVLLEDKTMDELIDEFINYIINIASGEYVKNEINGYREIAMFKTGITL